jgi:hypothetical protein
MRLIIQGMQPQFRDKLCPSCGAPSPLNAAKCVCGHQFRTNFAPLDQTQVVSNYSRPYSQPVYGQPYPPADTSGTEGLAMAGMVLGILSLPLFFFCLISMPCSVIGIVLSCFGLNSKFRSMAIAGISCGGLSLVASLVFFLAVIMRPALASDEPRTRPSEVRASGY